MSDSRSNTENLGDINEAIGKAINLLSENPQLLKGLSGILGQNQSPSQKEDTSVEDNPLTIDSIPPELTAKLPEIMSTLKSIKSEENHSKNDSDRNRVALLRAIKPYLSPERREMIDYLILISNIAPMLKNL